MTLLKRINWLNTIFIAVFTPGVTLFGVWYLVHTGDLHLATAVLAFGLLLASGFSITVGYHRLFSHRTYKAVWPVRLLLALFGASAFQGSILEWCTDHRNHHLYTDTGKDPYSIAKGFWYAHMGWLFTLDESKRDYSNVEELAQDPIVAFQHKYFVPLALFMGFGLPTLVASLWGDPLGGLIFAGFLRVVINHHATFAINSVCHVFGKKSYSDKQSARDNWITAFFTFGEGYHNFHHQFPLDYRNAVRFYQYDPSKWIIAVMGYLRLASDLKRVDEARILRYRLQKEQAEILMKVGHQPETFMEQITTYVKPIYQQLLDQLEHISELKQSYQLLKAEKLGDYKLSLAMHKLKLELANKELQKNLMMWRLLLRADQQTLLSLGLSR